MIEKKIEDYTFTTGKGRPFDMRESKPESKNDAGRNTPKLIDLLDLNQAGKAPVNFMREAGRVLPTFTAKDSKDIK